MSSSSLVFVNSGKIAIASSVMNQELFIGWGSLPQFVPAPIGVTAAPIPGSLPAGVYNYVVTYRSLGGETTISNLVTINLNDSQGVELTIPQVNGAIETLVYGRVQSNLRLLGTTTSNKFIDDGSITKFGKVIPTSNTTSLVPWSVGSIPPSVNIEHSRLLKEFIRRRITTKYYVNADINGDIITREGRWSRSETPTTNIYLSATFDINDGLNNIIYQKGLYLGTVAKPGFENSNILLPENINIFGSLIGLRNVDPISRTGSSKVIEEIVMVF